VLVAALGTAAGALWLFVERRRVIRIDEQWRAAHPDSRQRQDIS
jgi:hypothetical protein